jgi:hypothetical protein
MNEIGFWLDPSNEATRALPDPRDWVDEDWDPVEREAVTRYLRAGDVHIWVKGYSWCRFRCGIEDWDMGSKTLTDGIYVWPEGLPHYLEVHHVKPPQEFIDHVLTKQEMSRT